MIKFIYYNKSIYYMIKKYIIFVTIILIIGIVASSNIIGSKTKEINDNKCRCLNKQYYSGHIPENHKTTPEKKLILSNQRDLPDNIDWRNYQGKDYTTSIKSQGNCNSCYTFAALGCIESIINIKENMSNINYNFSEQFTITCLPTGSCANGGLVGVVFYYIMDNSTWGQNHNGIIPESCYPYQESDLIPCDNKCDDWEEKLVPISDYGVEYDPNQTRIKELVVNHGPIATAFYLYSDLYSYDDGIYEHNYGTYQGGHAVIIVGYNDSLDNPDEPGYWICKNSWGTNWGEDGWFKIAYEECDIGYQIYWVDYEPCVYLGDLDNDIDIDADDLTIFLSSFGLNSSNPNFNPNCDYDNDEIISFIDYQTWLKYYRIYNHLN